MKDVENCRIGGHGILFYEEEDFKPISPRLLLMDHCRNCRITGLALLKQPLLSGWCCLIGGSGNVQVEGISIISHTTGQDGIDIVGSQQVAIRNSLFHTGDDCIAIKALDSQDPSPYILQIWQKRKVDRSLLPREAFAKDVDDILIERCMLYAARTGNAFEIGYETRADFIQNIVFRDSDILGVHANGPGAAMGIHNGDRAWVRNVIFENIYVEHYYARLIDLQVLTSRWNTEPGQGRISDITLRNIFLSFNVANDGYSPSLIGSCNPEMPVENVTLSNFQCEGKPLTLEDLSLFTRNTRNIQFES